MGEYLKHLRELRQTKGISQKVIADYLGITVAAYSLYERGGREPSISMLKKIAEYYGVSIDELVDWEPKEFIKVHTLAAHFDGEEYTEEELAEIQQFAEFIKNRRFRAYADALSDMHSVQAAHERTDIEVTDEMKKHDDDIMNDPDF